MGFPPMGNKALPGSLLEEKREKMIRPIECIEGVLET
jgi:hypothetical protein